MDLAPAFAGSDLGELLMHMDALPHARMPETRVWKTLIVDRATSVSLRDGVLELGAELEVRCYEDGDAGWARQALVIDVPGLDFVGPRAVHDLGTELQPLAEIAGWLGLLHWLERADPAGFAALCAE